MATDASPFSDLCAGLLPPRRAAWQAMAQRALAAIGLAASFGIAAEPSQAQLSAFQKYSSCPSTGQRSGACPGYRIAYKVPPCAGGQALWTNMLWLTEQAAREKVRSDAAACAAPAR